jgi:hypothetical protein
MGELIVSIKNAIFEGRIGGGLLKRGPILVCLLFAAIYFFPVLLLKTKYCWPEEFFEEVYRPYIFQALKSGFFPLWNPMAGLGGTSGLLLSVVPWDYRLVLDNLIGPSGYKWVAYLDQLLLALAYGYALRSLRLGARGTLVGVLIGYFFFYYLGYVKVWSVYQKLASVVIAFPFLAGLIYQYEKADGSKLLVIPIAFFYWFSYHGGRVDYLLQMNVILVLYIVFLRWTGVPFSKSVSGKLANVFFNSRNKAYMGVLGFVLLANYWQLNWVYQVIAESGRIDTGASYGAFVIMAEFLKTFQYSFVIHLYLYYLAFTLFVLIAADLIKRGQQWKPSWKLFWFSLIITYLIFVDGYSWSWLGEDLAYWKERWVWGLLGLCGFLFCHVLLIGRYLKNPERNASVLFFQYPATFLLVLYFVFENPKLFNAYWIPSELEKVPFFYIGIMLVLLFFSVFSVRERTRLVSLMTLSVIYFIRCHLQLVSLRILGMSWYKQRDDIYILFFFSVMIVLGWLCLVHLCRRHFRSNRIIAGVIIAALLCFAYGFHDMYGHSPLNPEIRSKLPEPYLPRYRKKVERQKTTIRSLLDNYAPSYKYARISLPLSKMMSGVLLEKNISQVELYESTIPKYYRDYIDKLRGKGEQPKSRCMLPYPWFPNNIHRILKCPVHERLDNYESYIQPELDYYRYPDVLELLGVQFIFSDKLIEFPHLRLMEIVKWDLFLYRVLSRTSDRPFGAGLFLADSGNVEASCEWKEEGDWKLVNIETDLMGDKPIFRDRFHIGFDGPEKGCLLIPWTYSKLWSFNINGRDVLPKRGDTMFMVVPVGQGENRILAQYHPNFKWHLAFSLGITLLGVFWAVRFYLRNRKQRRGRG